MNIILLRENEMKKFIILALLLVVIVSGTFALDKNIGFGFGGNYAETKGTIDVFYSDADWTMTRSGAYIFMFFGISRFIELNLGYIQKWPDDIKIDGQSYNASELESTGALQAGIYGKFPITLGSRFVLFPTAGLDFEFTLDNSEEWWHELWLRGGVGADFFLGKKLFLRAHLLGGYAFPFGGDSELGVKSSWGFQAKLGIGWML